jgi:hypothetical protein
LGKIEQDRAIYKIRLKEQRAKQKGSVKCPA